MRIHREGASQFSLKYVGQALERFHAMRRLVSGSRAFPVNSEVTIVDRMNAHQRERRGPNWTTAAVSGFAAGAILMVVDMLWSIAVTGAGPWATSHMIAAIVMGPQALESSKFSVDVVTIALATHYALGIASGVVLVAISAPLRLDATIGIATLTGAVFGLVIYLVNFHGLVRFFPWFAEARGWATLTAHLIFGISVAVLYWTLAGRAEVRETVRARA